MQLKLFEENDILTTSSIAVEDIFEAYFGCRKNKRYTINALAFEADYEHNLVKLHHEINDRSYQPGHSVAFIVNRPVKREIFAADFRDRVVHHLIINKLNPLFEGTFINDSYACRVGKGTHYGIKRVDGFIKECSDNYQRDCYILKLDIQGFFMHINRNLLYDGLIAFIDKHYKAADKDILSELCKKVVFNHPAGNCIIKGNKSDWDGLPRNKSLFHSPPSCGLPIGNLTSQVFANFYMDAFDKFIKHESGIKYYGRYVDDFVIIHGNKQFLLHLINEISVYLQEKLKLRLHPDKIYLQHYSKGVKYLGAMIKPNRIYISNRTKGNFYHAIQKQNAVVRHGKPNQNEKDAFLCTMNSYLGILNPGSKNKNGSGLYKTYRLRKRIINRHLSGWWCNLVKIPGYRKVQHL